MHAVLSLQLVVPSTQLLLPPLFIMVQNLQKLCESEIRDYKGRCWQSSNFQIFSLLNCLLGNQQQLRSQDIQGEEMAPWGQDPTLQYGVSGFVCCQAPRALVLVTCRWPILSTLLLSNYPISQLEAYHSEVLCFHQHYTFITALFSFIYASVPSIVVFSP